MKRTRRLPENTADYCRWLAERIEERGGAIWLSIETGFFVGLALHSHADLLDGKAAVTLNYTIEHIDEQGGSEIVAAAENVGVAWAAFHAAIPTRPHGRLLLRHKARLLGEHPQRPAPITIDLRPE